MIDFERLVKAEDVLVAISRYTDETGHINMHIGSIQSIIDNVPTADRPHGEWIYNQYDGNPNIGNWHCSECRHIVFGGYSQKPYYNFCPNCGADMRKEGEAE